MLIAALKLMLRAALRLMLRAALRLMLRAALTRSLGLSRPEEEKPKMRGPR
jgi:hypothetical protein